MRSSTSSYKPMFRNTALAALVLGVLPAYAQVQMMHPGGQGGNSPQALGVGRQKPRRSRPATRDPRTGLLRWPNSSLALQSRLSPNGKIDWHAYDVARQQRAFMPLAPLGLGASSSGGGGTYTATVKAVAPIGGGVTPTPPAPASATWNNIGPINLNHHPFSNPDGNGLFTSPIFYGDQAVAGRVNAAVTDPFNTNIIYVAASGGGIHRSADGGRTWTALMDSPLSGDVPLGLAISSIAIDPHDTRILYAGSGDNDGTDILGSGLYKSTNSGQTWTRLAGLPSGSHCVTKVIVDPRNSNHLYAALGRDQNIGLIDAYSRYGLFLQPPFGLPAPSAPSGGIYSSNNGGATWSLELDTSGGGLFANTAGYVSNIVYNADKSLLYASVDFVGVFRKEETLAPGLGWIPVTGINAGPPIGSMEALNLKLPSVASTYRVAVATSPTDPDTAYYMLESYESIVKTSNRGSTFSVLGNIPGADPTSMDDSWGQAFYDMYIAVGSTGIVPPVGGVTPAGGGATVQALGDGGIGILPPPGGGGGTPPSQTSNSDIVYVGLYSLFRSTDGGQSFGDIAQAYATESLIHTDQHNMFVNPTDPTQFLAMNDGGIYFGQYDVMSGNVTYNSLNKTLSINQVYSVATSQTDSSMMLTGSQDNGTAYTTTANNVLNNTPPIWDLLFGGDGGYSLISPVESVVQYASIIFPGDIVSDYDYSPPWTNLFPMSYPPISEDPMVFTPLFNEVAADPGTDLGSNILFPLVFSADPQTLFSAGHFLYTFDDTMRFTKCPPVKGKFTKGAELHPKDTKIQDFYKFDYATALAASPTNANYVYVGTAQGALYYSSDGKGATVKDIGNQLGVGGSNALPTATVMGIASDPLRPNRLFVTLGGTSLGTSHVWRCDNISVPLPIWVRIDGGASGPNTRLPDIPITGIVLLPRDDTQAILVSTDLGLYYSANSGNDWTRVDTTGVSPITPAGATSALPVSQINQFEFNASTGYLNVATYGRGVWRSQITPFRAPLQIQVNLPSYRGSKSKLKARIDLFHAGQKVREASITEMDTATPPNICFQDLRAYLTIPVETHFQNLSAAGFYTGPVYGIGNYDIYLQVPGALRKKLSSINTAFTAVASTTLTLGDVDGDNQITVNDLNAIAAKLGQFTNGPEDVDGDGVVTANDFNIARANLGRVGD